MRKDIWFLFGAAALALLLVLATVWLANAPLHPAIQQAHLVLPDERIPH